MNRKDTTESKKYIKSISKRCRFLPHARKLCRDINAEVEDYIEEGGDSAHLAERFGSPDVMAAALMEHYDPEAYQAYITKQCICYVKKAMVCIALIATLCGSVLLTFDNAWIEDDLHVETQYTYPE